MLASGLPIVLIAGAPRPTPARAFNGHPYAIAEANSGKLALEWARDLHPDAILLASRLPDMSGVEACRLLRADLQVGPNIPLLLVSENEISLEERVAALRAGAWGFVRGSLDPAGLGPQLDAYMQAKRHVDVSLAQGMLDRATGLHSRHGLVRRARELAALMTRTHGSLACIVFALDSESASAAVAHVVTQNTRASDAVGTLEPTVVTVLAPGTDLTGAAKLAERVGGALREATGDGAASGGTVCVGYDAVANLTYAPMDPVDLLARARAAVRQGRPDPARAWLRSFDGSEP